MCNRVLGYRGAKKIASQWFSQQIPTGIFPSAFRLWTLSNLLFCTSVGRIHCVEVCLGVSLLLFVVRKSFNAACFICQGASRTAEDGDRERRTVDDRDERIGGAPRGSASRGLPPGPNPGAANRVRNGPEQAISNPASRVQQSGECTDVLLKSQTPAVCFFITASIKVTLQYFIYCLQQMWSVLNFIPHFREHIATCNFSCREGEEGEHAAPPRSSSQRIVLRPHSPSWPIENFHVTGGNTLI